MAIQIKSSFTKSTLHAYARILYYEAVQILLTSLTLILVLEKQRYFDRIVSSISTLEGQLKFYLNIQEEIMLKYDPDINTKLNATIEDLKVAYTPLTHITARFCFSIPAENIRKPLGSLMFSGGIEKQHWAVMG